MGAQALTKDKIPFGADLLAHLPSVTDADVLACIVALSSGGLDDMSGGLDDYIVSSSASLELLDASDDIRNLS